MRNLIYTDTYITANHQQQYLSDFLNIKCFTDFIFSIFNFQPNKKAIDN